MSPGSARMNRVGITGGSERKLGALSYATHPGRGVANGGFYLARLRAVRSGYRIGAQVARIPQIVRITDRPSQANSCSSPRVAESGVAAGAPGSRAACSSRLASVLGLCRPQIRRSAPNSCPRRPRTARTASFSPILAPAREPHPNRPSQRNCRLHRQFRNSLSHRPLSRWYESCPWVSYPADSNQTFRRNR